MQVPFPPSGRKPEPPATKIGVFYQERCLGHVLTRGCEAFEAYDHAEQSLGVFSSEDEATIAIWNARNERG
jgi:hypothetical protein